MGARLEYAKVIDRQLYITKGGRVHPGLQNEVQLQDAPGKALVFLVLRAWTDDHGTFTEQWRIETPGGTTVYESSSRELHMPTKAHVERLEDEVDSLELEYAADNYTLVFTLDDNEVARVNFPVVVDEREEEVS